MKPSSYCVDRVNGLDVKVLFHNVFLVCEACESNAFYRVYANTARDC